MDVAVGTTHVPVSRRGLITRVLSFLLLLILTMSAWGASTSWALEDREPLHWSGDKTVWDRKANIVRLTGNAAVHQYGETLTADYIELDLNERILDARGNCVYIAAEAVIYGEEMHFNLDTRTGTIVGGRVSSDRFTLTGERINKLSEDRFQTHRGEYTTCWDCPHSWSLRGEDVDLEFGGYAYMSNVTAKIKDAPALWVPYLIVPLKTERQTGFLFPRLRSGGPGFRIVLPFFWAISRSVDMTIGLGEYGGQGRRFEWEGRYRLSERSGGTAQFFYVRDRSFEGGSNRWAVDVSQSQELPWGVEQKLRLLEVSDNLYPASMRDVPGYGEAFISSDLIFAHSTNQVSSYVAARRFRNLLNVESAIDFDRDTVQVLPTTAITTNDKFLLPNLAAGLTLGATNFTRPSGAFDETGLCVGETPLADHPGAPCRVLREATRVTVTPSLYTTFRPWDVLAVVPSLQYRGYFYNFRNEAPNLSRGYLLFQTDVAAQLERVFETENPNVPRVKHFFRPLLTYSLIPTYTLVEDESHPFTKQMNFARENEFTGFNFDSNDIVPLDASRTYSNYFTPLGHSLSYGFSTQLVRRLGALDRPGPSYHRTVELQAGQSLNFRSLQEGGDRKPLSRLFAALRGNYEKFEIAGDYYYIPYLPITDTQKRHIFSGTLRYVHERAIHQQVLAFERSVSIGYGYNRVNSQAISLRAAATYSISDYIRPSASIVTNNVTGELLEWGGGLTFQSPSRCWKFDVVANRYRCGEQGLCSDVGVDFSLNLTGNGFGTLGDFATSALTSGP